MTLPPVLGTMRRNKFGAALIAAQTAVALAILCNAFSFIHHRISWSSRATGTDEANIFVVTSDYVGSSDGTMAARLAEDLFGLRQLDGVVDAFAGNSYPLAQGGWAQVVNLQPDQAAPSALTAYYFGDDHALATLGVRLIAGRNFTADEIADRGIDLPAAAPPGVIVSRALATALFRDGSALGKSIYVEHASQPVPIIGVVEQLQGPFTAATGFLSASAENSVIAPYRLLADSTQYIVRARPGRLGPAMRAAQERLRGIDRFRVLHAKSLTQARADAYRKDRGFIAILGVVCAVLLIVSAFGMVGLTSYWVTQRKRQIGIRRALGATRAAIVAHFQAENLVITVAGAAIGVALAAGLDLWAISKFETVRLSYGFVAAAAVVVVLLGQAAAFWPALRSASIPPAAAARNARE